MRISSPAAGCGHINRIIFFEILLLLIIVKQFLIALVNSTGKDMAIGLARKPAEKMPIMLSF
jgi:hypothetical protein